MVAKQNINNKIKILDDCVGNIDLIRLALEVNANNVNLVGFDGYNFDPSNDVSPLTDENQYLVDNFNLKSVIKINSFTPTQYKNTSTKSIFCNV